MAERINGSDWVSVIIPTYNRAGFVTDAMDSVWKQSYRPVELIVVNDGSTDNTTEVVEKWRVDHQSDKAFEINQFEQENLGAPAARNHGLRKASGEYIKFLDSDDLLHRSCLQKQVSEIHQVSEDQIVFGDLGRADLDGEKRVVKTYQLNIGRSTFGYLLGNIVNTPLPLHRRDLLQEVGGFSESLNKGQEYDLHLRLAVSGVGFLYRGGVVAYMRNVEDNYGISNNMSIANDYRPLVQFHDNRRELAREHYERSIPRAPARTIAQGYWGIGRELCRHELITPAESCFEKARCLVASEREALNGSPIYKAITSVLGPVRAEKALESIKSLVRTL